MPSEGETCCLISPPFSLPLLSLGLSQGEEEGRGERGVGRMGERNGEGRMGEEERMGEQESEEGLWEESMGRRVDCRVSGTSVNAQSLGRN